MDDNKDDLTIDKNVNDMVNQTNSEVAFASSITVQELINQNNEKKKNDLYFKENKRKRSNLFYVGIAYFLLVALLVGVRIMNYFGVFSNLNIYLNDIVGSGLIQVLIMFLLPVIALTIIKKQKIKDTFSDFQYKKISPKIIIISIIIGVLVFWLNGFISSIFAFFIELFGYEPAPSNVVSSGGNTTSFSPVLYFLVTVLCSCLLPAICEETAHRGLLLNVLKRYGVGKAIIISGLLFGLIHLNINQFFYASVIGCFLGLITIISKSIFPAMIIHFMNNFLSTCNEFSYLIGMDYLDLSAFANMLGGIFGNVLSNFVFFIFAILSVCLLVYLVFVIYKERQFNDIMDKIKQNNYDYFYGNDLKANQNRTLKNMLNASSVPLACLMYIQRNGEKRFWDNFDLTYSQDKKVFNNSWSFLLGAIITATLVTIFTFVWGVL